VKDGDERALRTVLETEGLQGLDIAPVAVADATNAKFAGEITNVDRVYSGRQENVIVTVQSTDGTVQRVTLGPSWFINGTGVAPTRGDTIALDTLVAVHNDEPNTTVTRLRNGEQELSLRDADGRPAWGLKSIQLGSETYASPYWRYVPASRLKGMRVVARGIECGTVHDIILDRNSARVAFLSITVDPKFTDAAEGRRLIPWSVVSLTLDGVARVDADRDMVSTSLSTPSDIAELSTGTGPETVYKAYKIPTPKFDTTDGRR
jgi:sporulation protein YlmC with PRC-barrel domain